MIAGFSNICYWALTSLIPPPAPGSLPACPLKKITPQTPNQGQSPIYRNRRFAPLSGKRDLTPIWALRRRFLGDLRACANSNWQPKPTVQHRSVWLDGVGLQTFREPATARACNPAAPSAHPTQSQAVAATEPGGALRSPQAVSTSLSVGLRSGR